MKTTLSDGTPIHCLRKPEARMLDHHVDGYLQHGIAIADDAVVFDVGANIGVFGVRVLQKAKNVQVYCFEPIPEIFAVLEENSQLHGTCFRMVFHPLIQRQLLPISRTRLLCLRHILNSGIQIRKHLVEPSKAQ